MHDVHAIAIYGKKKFGKTNLLRLLVRSIKKSHPDFRFVFFDDGRCALEEVYEEDKHNCSYITSLDEFIDFLDKNG